MKLRIPFIAGMLLLSGGIYAQTPDGETPANEGVCDQLIGGTPGLYGLCVAFCEAQDCYYDETQSMQCEVPNQKILKNYNKKKSAGDPEMPCLVGQPPVCPCFTYEEAAEMLIDPNLWYCGTANDETWYTATINVNSNPGAPAIWLYASYTTAYGGESVVCQYVRTDLVPSIIRQVEWEASRDQLPCHEIVEAVIVDFSMSETCYEY